jgi:prophage DNA circulation protein
MEPGSDNRIHPNPSSPPETDADVAPLIQKVGAPSIAQIEKLIGELQEAKDFLESEAERVQQEMVRYIQLIQMASASVEIISDTVSGWHQAGHPIARRFQRHAAIIRDPGKI